MTESRRTTSASPATVTLGDELEVLRLGLGARWLGGNRDTARAVLRRAVELGVQFIDTADSYPGSEEAIADALHPYPDGIVIATKGGQLVTDGAVRANGRPEYLRDACEQSLRRLRLETLDLYQLHMPDPAVPLEDSLGALVELRAEGKVREIGVSNVLGPELGQALDMAPLASVQNRFSLAAQDAAADLAECERRSVAFLPWAPLALGSLVEGSGQLAEVARARGVTPAQVAIAWLLQRSPVMVPIPGTSSTEHLEQNLAAAALRLSEDDIERLAQSSA